ncbi:MAG: hypothetical protein JW793_08930 [Acidobacteria bacterium]|nr:hypothetical protein [Acidobacteriota bacterium]
MGKETNIKSESIVSAKIESVPNLARATSLVSQDCLTDPDRRGISKGVGKSSASNSGNGGGH